MKLPRLALVPILLFPMGVVAAEKGDYHFDEKGISRKVLENYPAWVLEDFGLPMEDRTFS